VIIGEKKPANPADPEHRSAAARRRAAGVALSASGFIFFLAEFVAAAAWTDPPYSYTYHYISDWGVHGPSTAFDQYMYKREITTRHGQSTRN
jgi:hypothetical protein